MRQNETVYWEDMPYNDKFDTEYDSGIYTLTYIFAGPVATPVSLAAAPMPTGSGSQGWQTQFDATSAGKMVPGLWWWQAVLTLDGPPSQRIVAAEGELVVEPDFAALSTAYDGRSTMEIGLANAEQALTQFQASGGRVKSYNIAGRQMTFQDDKEILALVNYFRGRVEAERQASSGGDRRNIRIGFAPPSSGIPTDSSKNWPWW